MRRPRFDTRSNEEIEKAKENARNARPKSILESFEYIVELAENSNLDKSFFEKASSHINYASRKLKLSKMQIVLLALFVDRSEDHRIMISELAGYTGCRTTKILRLSNEIDKLEDLHYIRASRGNDSLSYRVPMEVLNALRANKPYEHKMEPLEDTLDFFDRLERLVKLKKSGEISYDYFKVTLMSSLEEVKNSQFATALKRYHLDNDDAALFLFMTHLYVENDDDRIGFSDIEDIYDNCDIPGWCKRSLRSRHSQLFKDNLIENVNEEGMARSDLFKLTEHAKEELLAELDVNRIGKSDKGLIKYDSIIAKTLYYNKEEDKLVDQLSSILSAERFTQVQERLKAASMRQGFCCIFYGAPGTGKTETVYQIARNTGRDIMRVDVDKIKSCWVGESEKNLKALFDRYRNICKEAPLAPILLFNEADAVLGVRMEGASRAVDKMENSLQNIILQEMESLDGILIATTNLTCNLDKAFERRFLYKIKFDKPSVEARAHIWESMLKGLSAEEAEVLAKQFDFSGGEIENIVRKHSVNAILSGKETIDLAAIIEACRYERLSPQGLNRIGF